MFRVLGEVRFPVSIARKFPFRVQEGKDPRRGTGAQKLAGHRGPCLWGWVPVDEVLV